MDDNSQFIGKDGYINQVKGKQIITILLIKSKYIYFYERFPNTKSYGNTKSSRLKNSIKNINS